MIRWLPEALNALEREHAYLAERNPRAAVSVVRRVRELTQRLERFPRSGRAGRVSGTRELTVTGTPYIVVYRVRAKQVQILLVLHGARKWPDQT